jgi:hypothetical protein
MENKIVNIAVTSWHYQSSKLSSVPSKELIQPSKTFDKKMSLQRIKDGFSRGMVLTALEIGEESREEKNSKLPLDQDEIVLK